VIPAVVMSTTFPLVAKGSKEEQFFSIENARSLAPVLKR
jgi:hypothetical protein